MKKYLVLAVMFFVSACAHGPIIGDEDCTYHTTPRKNYRVEEPRPQPVPVIVQHAQPSPCQQAIPAPVVVQAAQPCNGCQPTTRTTREPVEIVYKRVTYTTTYEPKTTSNVTYEREAIKNATVQEIKTPVVKEVVVEKPVVKEVAVEKPVIKEVVVQQPTVSKVIETQVTQEPVKISIEEVK